MKLEKQGNNKIAEGEELIAAGREYSKEGIGDMVGGGAQLGSAAATEDIANRLEEKGNL